MAAVSYEITNILEKMQSYDKDVRLKATNDLMQELQKDSLELDDDSERKVVRVLFELLEDKYAELQNLAVQCMAPLVDKVSDRQVVFMVNALLANMVSDKKQLRDISTLGLETVIAEVFEVPGSIPGNIRDLIHGVLTPVIAAIEKEEPSVPFSTLYLHYWVLVVVKALHDQDIKWLQNYYN